MSNVRSNEPAISDSTSPLVDRAGSTLSKYDQNTNLSSILVTTRDRWAWDSGATTTWMGRANPVPWSGLWFMALLAIFWGSRPLGNALGVRETVALTACAVIVAAGAWIVWRRTRTVWKLPSAEDSHEPDAGQRVALVASRAMLDRLGGLSLEPFEPRLFRVLGAQRGAWWIRWAVAILAFVAAMFALLLVRGGGRLAWPTGSGGLPWLFDVQAAIFLAYLPTLLLWPTYYRVVPGRIDVLEFSVLGARLERVCKLDLRHDRVAANAATGYVIVRRESGEHVLVNYAGLPPRRAEFAKAVAEAAISPHPTPPLPDDELTG